MALGSVRPEASIIASHTFASCCPVYCRLVPGNFYKNITSSYEKQTEPLLKLFEEVDTDQEFIIDEKGDSDDDLEYKELSEHGSDSYIKYL